MILTSIYPKQLNVRVGRSVMCLHPITPNRSVQSISFDWALSVTGLSVGAVDYAFTHPLVEKRIADPKVGTTVDDLLEWDAHVVFICAPTPMSENHTVDASIVEEELY